MFHARRHRPLVHQHGTGFTLIEVLVTAALLGIGLAGFALLFTATTAQVVEAQQRSLAALHAGSFTALAAVTRAPPSAWPPATTASTCLGAGQCTDHAFDASAWSGWQRELRRSAPAWRSLWCGPASSCPAGIDRSLVLEPPALAATAHPLATPVSP